MIFLAVTIPIVIFSGGIAFADGSGTVEGYVRDSQTHDGLPGANVLVVGTSLGASTDLNGRFVVSNVPAGSYVIRATYIGYNSKEYHVRVTSNETVKINLYLESVGVKGKEVVVTAQAAGQNAAINQQLSSDKIVNVVSAARIQELPDANAAESVGRLPGVSVIRSGGEADEVVIRGLQPKYNEIMIDGIQISSANPDNRSTNLSDISSNMLEGIQVWKTVTPDMNADVIGGVVNFELREAQVKQPGVPQFSLIGQGGYNNLPDAYNRFNNYKYVGSVEDRFLGDRFGVFAQVDVERKNLSSNEFGASYDHVGNSNTQYVCTGLSLYDIPRDRKRYNGALVLDYRLPEGRIKFTNFLSSGLTNVYNREEDFYILSNSRSYGLASASSILNVITDGIDYQQQLPIFNMDLRLSHAYSETRDPGDWAASFIQSSAGLNQFINLANPDPQEIPRAAVNNDSAASLNTFNRNSSFSRQRALTGSLDLKTTLNLSDLVSAEIKFGGEIRYQTRSYNYQEFDGTLVGNTLNKGMIYPFFSLPADGSRMTYWLDPNFSYGKFLGGDYTMVAPLNLGMLSRLATFLNENTDTIAAQGNAAYYGLNNYASTTNNYTGNELTTAAYAMSVINIGPQLTLIPGVRYQNLRTNYTGTRGIESSESYFAYNHYDTTVTQNHGYWLPDVSLKYKPLSWFDVRLSYSNTLAYPDYNAIIPRIAVGTSSISWSNIKLVPSRSTNYDAYLSFYNNSIGLFTAGVFLKQIRDLIYSWSFYASGTKALPYYPYTLLGTSSPPTGTYDVSTFVNDSSLINDYGMELDWETHFWYLPGPLSGLVFSVNYTHIFSKARYPYTFEKISSRSLQYIDTAFTDRLLDQPDNIMNLSLGFDYRGFSVRVAMIYQSNIFTGPNFWPQLRSHTAAYRRWDLAANQKLPWFGLEVYGDLNNINGANDISVIQGGGVPTSEQDYGLTADLGVRWQL